MFSFQLSIRNMECISSDSDILWINAKQAANPHACLPYINHLPIILEETYWGKIILSHRLLYSTTTELACWATPGELLQDSCLLALKTMFCSEISIVLSGLASQYAELQRTILLHNNKISNSNIADAVL